MDDTEYRRDHIEQRLRRIEERFRLAQVASGIGWFEWDLSTDEWEWTPYIAELFGLNPDEARPCFADWEHAIFPDDALKLHAAVDIAEETGAYYTEFRVKHGDGSVHWIAGKGQATQDENGKARWIGGVYYEISERKHLEARLLASNEMLEARVVHERAEVHTLETLIRTGAALNAELSPERVVQTLTDAAVDLTGAQYGAFFLNQGDKRPDKYELYALSGAPREAFAKFPVPSETAIFGPTFRGEAIIRSDDITADPRYGLSPPHYGIPPGHPPVRSYLAVPVTSRAGRVLGGLIFGHADPAVFTERVARIVTGIAAQAAIAIDNAQLYDAAQRELAARRQAETELQAVNDQLEERVADEVKHRQQTEDRLRQAQKMETIGQLTGGVAHDFNNLLTVILGNLETIERRLTSGHEFQPMVSAALGSAWRAAQLTERLLAFARRQPLMPEIVSLNRLVAGMSDLLRRALGESVGMETVLAAGLWNSFVDANQLENVLINLAVNARDAMEDGGKLTIETANCYLDEGYCALNVDVEPGQYVGVFVTDTGTGMSPEVIEKAFEPFFTTKEVGHGTGLGLSQVYGFIKQSSGHVKIYSGIGEGTTVKLYFPRHRMDAETVEPQLEEKSSPPARAGETVLVVEDDPGVRVYTEEVVRELGYEVFAASNGAEALRQLERHPEVRLLFTDVGLPGGMNGRQLADEAVARQPGLKVLFTTGYARNAIVHHGRVDPGVEVVFKPFTHVALAHKFRRVFDS
ncbi:MAG TPA: GAF domain-containing protein [Stellaceae bacterium]|nr:GAF domain-containing protein [Stellaceae bacterium]